MRRSLRKSPDRPRLIHDSIAAPGRLGEFQLETNPGKRVQEFIARENIKRFEAQLAACVDPEQRKTLSRLLDNEKQRLAQALAEKQARPEAS